MAKRRTWRWVTRSHGTDFVDVWLHVDRPRMGEFVWRQKSFFAPCRVVCSKEFKAVFGITIPPGACVRVEFTARIVE